MVLSVDELSCFAFHDATLEAIEFQEGKMKWRLDGLNVTTENSQNNFPKDMCINKAEITFEAVKIIGITFGAYDTYGANRVLIQSVMAREASPDEFDHILKQTLESYCFIYSMEMVQADSEQRFAACFNIDGGAGNYDLTFEFAKSIVEWDEFYGEAWYEDKKWKK